MKALYESILDDIDVQMSQGDEWAKESKAETKEFLKAIGTIKSYNTLTLGINTDTLSCRLFAPYTIEQLGFNANAIKIIISTVEETSDFFWKMKISIYKVEDKSKLGTIYVKPSWEKKVYIKFDEFNKAADVVKDLLKQASKSLDAFKKFLNNMEKWNEQLVGTNLLLK